ncbi:hypothetical protein BJ878DRAFT_546965 [Calycina marina]|uniref:Helicase C-terminal domain-containing protein n=1 Tax=Calycina marina TaxID=1763456 RepID=A0A9P7YTS1_9HELO|nr:hypothetical protein BJ878DRAFT_546965 [Calycina marina]
MSLWTPDVIFKNEQNVWVGGCRNCQLALSETATADRLSIQVYHSHTTVNDKNAIYEKFSKPDSKIRIIVATESMGTGVDLCDVKRVVQYGFPLDRLLSVLIQQFSRAARMAAIKGEAILVVES